MNYAEKYGFTPEQAQAVIEHEKKLGVYDGRFDKDVDENENKPTEEAPQTPKRGPGRPSKGGNS